MNDIPFSRAQAYEASDDVGRNTSANPTMGDIINARFDRRSALRGMLGVAAIGATISPLALVAANRAHAQATSAFSFKEVAAGVDEKHHVAEGYNADVLIRWGDPISPDGPEFDPMNQSAEAQQKQFGYNSDYTGYLPIDGSSEHGLLVVNHEYTNEELIFPGISKVVEGKVETTEPDANRVAIEMAAHGGSVIEIKKVDGKWTMVRDGKANRRITAETEMTVSGPAAGSDRMKSSYDPTGTKVRGMVNNCAGGLTPWNTWLTCEENFHGYFTGKLPEGHAEAANHKRYGTPGDSYSWGKFHDRFDISKDAHEPNRFGWVVEIDPFDPNSIPKKRTAMGRFKHEGAANIINSDGRLVVYQGDDERFEYVYRFVTGKPVNTSDPKANADLLDTGTLSVAKYNEDGTGVWLPLVFGQGPLTAENGFKSQADVLIETRRAADLLGATKMDRPEDVEANPKTHRVYVMLTNNTKRKPEQVDKANPRPESAFGHIIEMVPANNNHAGDAFTWEILLKCGDPSVAAVGASFSSATTKDGWFGMPDTVHIDADGRLWIGTDGMGPKATGRTDGLYAVDTEGPARGTSKLFFRCPVGAELCGPVTTPDLASYFVAIQHPADEGPDFKGFERPSIFEDPSTRWPDFKDGMPPRPSVVAITKADGGTIGA